MHRRSKDGSRDLGYLGVTTFPGPGQAGIPELAARHVPASHACPARSPFGRTYVENVMTPEREQRSITIKTSGIHQFPGGNSYLLLFGAVSPHTFMDPPPDELAVQMPPEAREMLSQRVAPRSSSRGGSARRWAGGEAARSRNHSRPLLFSSGASTLTRWKTKTRWKPGTLAPVCRSWVALRDASAPASWCRSPAGRGHAILG